jgi:hypothetical protein
LVFGKDGKNYDGVLENPATETLSLIEAQNRKIPALHIEAKPQFRIPAKGVESITPDGLVLGKGLAQAVMRC